ncbi:ABC transporter permease [Demequina sp. NBRC 110054]|uniref:ABC transporter permease n=1 Tax=Demequina sp. NBRC 110054 TaxID=1570343 RepID=UPI000A065CA6|nr:ABC transporter permease [Demequina sp. NBRC 110054]
MTTASVPAPAPARRRGSGRRLSGSLITGMVLVGLVILMALMSFIWTPYDPTVTTPDRYLTPSLSHLLGTDALGRDVFSQLLYGARTTLYVGIIAVGVAALLGVPFGILAAAGPRWANELIMRGIDLMLAFPALLLAIILGAALGVSTFSAMVAIGIATAPAFARLARSGTLQVLSTEYVTAARISRRGPFAIAWRHVLPNIAPVLIVQASVSYGVAVLAESGLSYLGYGTPPPTPTWGRMLQEAQTAMFSQPLLVVWPSVAIIVAVLGFNLLGDGLRDRFDPKMEDR